jgi:hypothetical protein
MAYGLSGAEVFSEVWPVAPCTISEPVAYQAFLEGQMEGGRIQNPGPLGERFKRCVAAVEARGGAYDPRAVCAAAGRRKYGSAEMARRSAAGRRRARRNPEAAAAAMSEAFHGRPVQEVVDVTESVHVHEHLAELGRLISLEVVSRDGATVKLSGFDGALLCSNEAGDQLFVRGGDQYVDVAEFGFDPEDLHEVETLGHVVRVVYHTTKTHLGAEGGKADYFHDFGEEDKGRRRRYPDLLYRWLDPSLEFAGGAYSVRPEGITN